MQRRGTVRLRTALVATVMALVSLVGATAFDSTPVMAAVATVPADDEPVGPPGTVTEFYPESANLSDCVGLVEKPGCGSDSRGGWHQMLVFVALFFGLGIILWRVSRGISSNRRVLDATVDADPDATTERDPAAGSDLR